MDLFKAPIVTPPISHAISFGALKPHLSINSKSFSPKTSYQIHPRRCPIKVLSAKKQENDGYEKGIPSPLTPIEFLERATTAYGKSTSMIHGDKRYTWEDTYNMCLKIASVLSRLEIQPGDVVSVVAPNTPEMYELHFANPMTNAILNTVNIKLNACTILTQLQHSGSKLVFVDYESAPVLLEVVDRFRPPHCGTAVVGANLVTVSINF